MMGLWAGKSRLVDGNIPDQIRRAFHIAASNIDLAAQILNAGIVMLEIAVRMLQSNICPARATPLQRRKLILWAAERRDPRTGLSRRGTSANGYIGGALIAVPM
jgi:hypothetical protein